MIEPRGRLHRPARVVVDMQNDFVRAGAPMEVLDARATIAAHRALIDGFRARGLPVLFTRFIASASPSLLWHGSPQVHPPTRACWKGHPRRYADVEGERDCSAVIDELAPAPGEHRVEKFGWVEDSASVLRALG